MTVKWFISQLKKSFDATRYQNKELNNIALENIQHTLKYLGIVTDTLDALPKIPFLEKSLHKLYLIEIFNQKAEILFDIAREENSNYYLELALENVGISDILIGLIQNDRKEERSHFYWQEMASMVYANGVAISKALNNPEKVFYFMERNKATLLTSAVILNSKKTDFPEAIILEEKDKLNKIIKVEYEISKASKKQLGKLQSDLFNAKDDFKVFRDSVQQEYPDYNTNIIQDVLSLRQAQASLSNNEAAVSYLWGVHNVEEQVLYGLFITKNTAEVFKIDSLTLVNKAIVSFKKSLTKPIETTQEQKIYNEIAYKLYKELLPVNALKRFPDLNKLIIIPDGNLQNLPYEALLTNDTKKSYLLHRFTVSYGYSSSFLIYNKSIKRTSQNYFTGIAPTFYDNQNLPDLPNTHDELGEINKLINGTIYLRKEATKENFLASTKETKIIHLATHANATDTPWIAFANDKMYINEIYNSKNQAELVVLSACNTSLGETIRGEGVLSLARGFFYAGANSVVSNAWEANDKSTNTVVQSFYKYLSNGESKAKALQKAKIDYLKTHSLSEVSPHYWASFMLVGDYGILIQNNSYISKYKHFMLISLIPLFLVLICFFKKIKIIG